MSFIAETERLGMRLYHPDDAEAFLALCSDPEVMRYIPGEASPGSVEEMRQMLADYPDYKKHGFGRWSCIHKETGRFIGFTGLKFLEDFGGEVDLGYRFFPGFGARESRRKLGWRRSATASMCWALSALSAWHFRRTPHPRECSKSAA